MALELPSFSEAALADGRLLLECDRLVKAGLADRRASVELRLGDLPPHVGYVVVGGLHTFTERLDATTVNPAAIDEAARLLALSPPTVALLRAPRLAIDVDGMPDGTVAFSTEAIATLEGRLIDVLVAATMSLPWVRRATCVATAAARLATAAEGDTLVEAASCDETSREAAALVARAAFVGGVEATANPIASVLVEIPLRATASRELAALSAQAGLAADPAAAAATARSADPDGWASLPPETWVRLERGDEEQALLEARRVGTRPTGWVATSFGGLDIPLVADVVALEEGGAWRAVLGSARPGRKMAVRYVDDQGRLVCDAICSAEERLRDARTFEAASYETLTRPLLRQGRPVAPAETARDARLRARAGRLRVPADVLRLRSPARFRVLRSDAVRGGSEPSSNKRARSRGA